MGAGCSASAGRIEQQEQFVRESLPMAREALGGRYTDRQIKGKLRHEYHGQGHGNGYVLQSDWGRVRKRLVRP